MSTAPLTIVIADDSAIVLACLREILSLHPSLKVVAEARSVVELEAAVERHRPRIVTLDLLMPGRPGLAVIRRLSERTSVVVVSDAGADSALALESLAQGACAFVPKRELSSPSGHAAFVRLLLNGATPAKPPFLVAVVGSTGAMPALEGFASQLGQLEVPVVLVQHLPAARMGAFADWLTSLGLRAEVVERPRALLSGTTLVSPGDRHLCVARGERVEFDDSPPVGGHRPSAEVLLKSLVTHAAQTVVVVLSGMGRDGSLALAALCARGATCIIQRPDTCAVPSMPEAALRASGGSAWSLSPKEIGAALRRLAGTKRVA